MANKLNMKKRIAVACTVGLLSLGMTSCSELMDNNDSAPVNTVQEQLQPRLSYGIYDILQKYETLDKETYKMVIGDGKIESKENLQNLKTGRILDSKSRAVAATPERIAVAEDLIKFESQLEQHLKSFITSSSFKRNDIIISMEYQLVSDDGLLSFVNYRGETKTFLIPPTQEKMGSNLIGEAEIYDSIVSPIENYFAINPELLRENFDIIVGDGEKSDYTPPTDLKNQFKEFEKMLEDNLATFLKRSGGRAILPNDVLIHKQYQFYLEDGEWEIVNYEGKSIKPHTVYKNHKAIESDFTREDYIKYNNFL